MSQTPSNETNSAAAEGCVHSVLLLLPFFSFLLAVYPIHLLHPGVFIMMRSHPLLQLRHRPLKSHLFPIFHPQCAISRLIASPMNRLRINPILDTHTNHISCFPFAADLIQCHIGALYVF
jgi:hypothetical protein